MILNRTPLYVDVGYSRSVCDVPDEVNKQQASHRCESACCCFYAASQLAVFFVQGWASLGIITKYNFSFKV